MRPNLRRIVSIALAIAIVLSVLGHVAGKAYADDNREKGEKEEVK